MTLHRHRLYFGLAVLTIALAASATTVVFSMINALWLRQPNVRSGDELVVVGRTRIDIEWAWSELGMKTLRDTGVFEQLAGEVVTYEDQAALRPRVVIESIGREVETLAVTPNYFETLGVPVTGRDFTASDRGPGNALEAIISDSLWRTHFGGRSDVLGATIAATPEPITVIGVAPPRFSGAFRGQDVDVWVPHRVLHRLSGIAEGNLTAVMLAIGRLRPGETAASAQAWFQQSTARRFDRDTVVLPLHRMLGSLGQRAVAIDEGRFMTFVSVTAVLVLASGCCTLMALLCVHYEKRRLEFAVRAAVGASERHIIRLLSSELAMLAAVSVAATLVTTSWLLRLLPQFRLPSGIDFGRLDLSYDWRVYAAATVVCVVATMAAAGFPLLRVLSRSRSGTFRMASEMRPSSSLHLRRAILGVHACMATVLIVSASLFAEGVQYGTAVAPGFDTQHSAFVSIRLKTRLAAGQPRPDPSEVSAGATLLDKLWAVPGIEAVALGPSPLNRSAQRSLTVNQRVRSGPQQMDLPVAWLRAGQGYLEAIGAPLLVGRAGGPHEAVVTRTLAEAMWPDESPIGRSITYGPFTGEVVGVVDLSVGTVSAGKPAAIVTFDQPDPGVLVSRGTSQIFIAVSTSDPAALGRTAEVIRALFPEAVDLDVRSGSEQVHLDFGRERMAAWLFSGFSLIAALLGIGGVFGLVAYAVSIDGRTFAIMLAIGATSQAIMRQAIWRGLGPVVLGIAAGIPAAMMFGQVLEARFIGLRLSSVHMYFAPIAAFLVCASAASIWGARRVRRISPVDVLRGE